MDGSRLRPLLCVGLAYFAIAVVVPTMLLSGGLDGGWGAFRISGTCWSLAAGAAGVFGSLGIIMAFNWGGRPIYVMPLVFGGAPVVNTFWTILQRADSGPISPFFWAGLILVIGGSAIVLIFSPKGSAGSGGAKKNSESKNSESKKEVPPRRELPAKPESHELPVKGALTENGETAAETGEHHQDQDMAPPSNQPHDENN